MEASQSLLALPSRVQAPHPVRTPAVAVLRRIGSAVALVLFIAFVVRVGRAGWTDVNDDPISILDALYYASVTVTTTGYGDITAITPGARLATIFLITPARIVFLILVVGTTVEVLTEQTRDLVAGRRWRKNVKDHIVICGFGSTGQSAALDLLSRGVEPDQLLAVDTDAEALARAEGLGLATLLGNATRNAVLEQAEVHKAKAVIVAPNRDDTAVLVTLTVRELNPKVHVVAGVREQENLHLLVQGGADEVVDATAAVGRMLGLGTVAPGAGRVLDDLLDAGHGLELVEVEPVTQFGTPAVPDGSMLVAIMRDGQRLAPNDTTIGAVRDSDRLVVLRATGVE